jgi:hypothetical protein
MIKPKEYELMVFAFVITAAWDVVLRMFSERKLEFMGIEKLNWVVSLRPYFKYHTVLSAALIAGFVGAVTCIIINKTFPQYVSNSISFYLLWVAFISALVGIPMRYSGMFPYLKKYYYDPLPITTIFSDALSGVIVAISMIYVKQISIFIFFSRHKIFSRFIYK